MDLSTVNAVVIGHLRKEIANIERATKAGTVGFEDLAAMHGSEIHVCKYRELTPYCDTMAYVNGQCVITEQNLQYFPAKVRYFIPKGS